MIGQEKIFSEFESDNYFMRNKEVNVEFDERADLPLQVMGLYNLKPKSVLEIGASNGFRLDIIRKRWNSRVVAVEPSKEAVQDGRKRYPEVEFHEGVACSIPLKDTFDLVIVNFVFHWVGRDNLLHSISEIDRLLEDGGHLVIGDFFPSTNAKVPYHHLPEKDVFTYKQNYAGIFQASGIYQQVCQLSADHSSHKLTTTCSERDRFAVWLLRKSLTGLYANS